MFRRVVLFLAAAAVALISIQTAGAENRFVDVPDGHIFQADIEWLADEGITLGCNPPTNDMYCPNKAVTRGQMAAFLVRALNLTDDGGGNTFTDDDGSVFETDIAKLAAARITLGCNPPTNDMYCPNKAVTRGQMAAFLNRALTTQVGPAITSMTPTSGQPGTIVTLYGSGFTQEQLRVSFSRAIGSADVVAADLQSVQVVVPEGAETGPIEIETRFGSAKSPTGFTVTPKALVQPQTHAMLRSVDVQLSCTLSGLTPPNIEWSIVSGSSPGAGTVADDGTYTAPDSLPTTNPVVVRCSSTANPSIYDDAAITILPPTPAPGGATVLAAVGGEIRSNNNEVQVDIPAGALAADTELTVEIVPNRDLPPTPDDVTHVGSVDLGPHGVSFSEPATATFTLRHWISPGTSLDVTSGAAEPQGVIPVAVATVDVTGMLATAEIDQTGIYMLEAYLDVEKDAAAGSLADALSNAYEFEISLPRSTEMVEGLTIPVLISRREGAGAGMGPFYEGVNVVARLDGVSEAETPLTVGPVIQPDSTGWELGTFVNIPVLPDCADGERKTGHLRISYVSSAGESDSIYVPYSFTCLDELEFARGSAPNPIPLGGSWDEETATLGLLQHTYRFSRVSIGAGAELKVKRYGTFSAPLTLEVTSDVVLNDGGRINLTMEDGAPGFHQGSGGTGGLPHGGDGGACGNCTSDDKSGDPGEDATYGGTGGAGGAPWEYTDPIEAVVHVIRVIAHAAAGDAEGAISAAFDLTETAVKLTENDDNQYVGAGYGGNAPSRAQIGVNDPPQSGGGGGGSGEADISFQADDWGSGGGGGGAGAHPLQMTVGGNVILEPAEIFGITVTPPGVIIGRGSSGGLGGGGFFDSSAPGGGGGGGNGAYIAIEADWVYNSGTIDTRGGYPGLSQICPDDWGSGSIGPAPGEYCGGDEVYLPIKGIGEMGHDGVFKVDAYFTGQWPVESKVLTGAPSDPWRQRHRFAFPGLADTDGDGLKDGLEDHIGTDKYAPDSDLDGLTDYAEVVEHGTDPNVFDTDGDGLSDGSEVAANPWETDPLDPDTDGDGYHDDVEIDKGSDPTNPASTPEICDGLDNDLDGLVDEECEQRLDHKGKLFYIPFLPTIPGADPDLKLIITSEGTSAVQVEYPTGTIIANVTVTPDEAQEIAIPSTAATGWPAFNSSSPTLDMNVVRVTASYDVAIVAENKTTFVADRALALPNDVLGEEYFVSTWLPGGGDAVFAVIAAEDGAGFTFDIPGPTPPISYDSLERGEGIMVNAGADLAGIRIVATGKIVVANGNDCATIGGSYCEHLYEIALPTSRWGTDYLMRSNRSEDLQSGYGLERNYYRIVAGADGTQLTVNNTLIATGLAAGTVVDLDPEDPFYGFDTHIKSNNKIHVTQFMSSICDEWPTDPTCSDPYADSQVFGDASMSNVVPTGNFPLSYRFTDVGCNYYPWNTALNVVAATADAQAGNVVIDGAAIPSGSFTTYPTNSAWSVATVTVGPSGPPCNPFHASVSPSGHAVYLIGTGLHSAVTHPLGYDFED